MLRLSRFASGLALAAAATTAAAVACSSFDSSPESAGDAGTEAGADAPFIDPPPSPTDAGVDVEVDAATCDLTKPFTKIDPVPGVNAGTGLGDAWAWLSADEKTIWFTSGRSGNTYRILTATRPNRGDTFSIPVPIQLNDHATFETRPTLNGDAGLLVYARTDGGAMDLYSGTLSGDTYQVSPIASLNTATYEVEPYLVGNVLYFASSRTNGFLAYSAILSGAGASGLTTLSTTSNSGSDTFSPVLSPDQKTIYFASSRDAVPNKSKIYVATRTDVSSPTFTGVQDLTTVDNASLADERPNWVSPDGCRLYFHSDRNGGVPKIYVAERQ